MPADQEVSVPLQDQQIGDIVAFTEVFREYPMDSFDTATENILQTIRCEDPFDDRHVVAAVDFTHVPYHVWPWTDKDEEIPKLTYPPMVSGYVDLDEILLDCGFYTKGVRAEINGRGLLYTMPVRKYESDYEAITHIKSEDGVDAAVNHDIPVGIDGDVDHTAEYLYVPATSDDAEGKYAVFVTNRGHVYSDEIAHVTNSYSRRWDIENQYKSVQSYLPKTSSTDYRVRLFNFTFAALLYNL